MSTLLTSDDDEAEEEGEDKFVLYSGFYGQLNTCFGWDLKSYVVRGSGRGWTKYVFHLNICQSRLARTLRAGTNLLL
jgi:hypothetical protein